MLEFFKGSRKFTVMAALIVIAVILRCLNLLESADFASLLSGTGVAFMGSNAVEHIMSSVKDFVASKAAPREDE
jgi:hypothetical protein